MFLKLFTFFFLFCLILACNDPNEVEIKCGSFFKPTCLDQNKTIDVTKGCVKECFCKPGYIKTSNEIDGFCVPKTQCSEVQACLSANAVYTRCGGLCGPSCDNPVPFPCPCKEGCSCRDGYIKTTIGGPCVSKEQCPVSS